MIDALLAYAALGAATGLLSLAHSLAMLSADPGVFDAFLSSRPRRLPVWLAAAVIAGAVTAAMLSVAVVSAVFWPRHAPRLLGLR